ncbi:hypothetical protein J7F03_04760 [Streptomyces sp. ISL-43]|uniref:hypothetical protein n=1 Tax=Streptomyces sp. ISL-43 TaxID=2819183 RepID=UPI001BEB6540|nr:hypothetical protein [Streptomyces sp. ISL-43]MBT2446405.1 hypothetical protein [Streptomyces sp. ISL-43]
MSPTTGARGSGTGAGHAVVIGSSLAGLTAATAPARTMDRVTVVDRSAATVILELGRLLVTPRAAFRRRVPAAALRGPRGPLPSAPPSTTHGAAGTIVQIGVLTGSSRPRGASASTRWSRGGSAAQDDTLLAEVLSIRSIPRRKR